MIRIPIHRLLLVVFAGFTIAGCSPDYLLPRTEGMQELNFRQGLPNFFSKVKSGKEVTVAYLGGSITQVNNGWRDITYKWLDSAYTGVSFKQVNAALGGTASDLGVFRMDRDVLDHHPDLIFVEFASNDTGTPEEIYRSMEGIVRKAWKKYPNTDLCFIYTLLESSVKALQNETYQPTALAMEKIAEHYGIPSIHMGVPVVQLLNSGKLIFTGIPSENPDKIVFTTDGTHPQSAAGHKIYAGAVERGFKRMESFAAQMPHPLPAPYISDNWESAQMVSLSDITIKNDWELLPPSDPVIIPFAGYLPGLYKAKVPGASFTIKFNGKVLGVYDIIGPASGIVDVTIDGKPAIEVFRFDAWCDYYRLHNFFLKGLQEGDHEVRFHVTGKQFDKAAILARRNISITNPDLYKENSWFVGNVMLVGKINP